ncbi:MAG: trypsin-like peptidase domain-containing protein [Methylococcales bacterium]|nr:trypsin-like peptidase domain-containing protein [Methylococcales bacterium]
MARRGKRQNNPPTTLNAGGLMKGFAELFHTKPKSLGECHNVWLLAMLLNTDYDKLSSYLYSEKHLKYRYFTIKKKSGGERLICSPVKRLKNIQYLVMAELENYHLPKSCAHGFVKGRSVKSNASAHTNKRYVLNLDLLDFFPSISFGRVKRLFECQPFNLQHSVASVLAHICCHEGFLPQGAPTSPMISNMIAFKLDGELQKLAKNNRCSYSRYADDITFSFTHRRNRLPSKIVNLTDDRVVTLGAHLCEIIQRNGFEINDRKTRIQHYTQHQRVTGLTVNKKVNISRGFIRKTSSMLHSFGKFGAVNSEKEHFEKYFDGYMPGRQIARMKEQPGDLFIKKIKGRINYIRMIRGTSCNIYRRLMYSFTVAIGEPNENYAKSWLDVISDSTFIIDTYTDENITQGTGFLIKDYGIVTNWHVIEGVNADNMHNVKIYPWHDFEKNLKMLEFVKSDDAIDLGLINPTFSVVAYKPLEINEKPDYSEGTTVYTIGYPNHKAGEKPTVLEAKIQGITTFLKQKRIKLNINVQHGYSGGPVIDSNGLVIGVVTNGNRVGSSTNNDGAFIPIETLLKYFN